MIPRCFPPRARSRSPFFHEQGRAGGIVAQPGTNCPEHLAGKSCLDYLNFMLSLVCLWGGRGVPPEFTSCRSQNPMFRSSWKYLLMVVVLTGVLGATASPAQCGWWHRAWACGCYSPCWGTCGYGWPCGGCYAGCRPVRWGWAGCGCWDPCCSWGGCWDNCVTSCCDGGTVMGGSAAGAARSATPQSPTPAKKSAEPGFEIPTTPGPPSAVPGLPPEPPATTPPAQPA